ncbi:MAG: histidine kinase [Nostoc sp. CreGUA01]|nr:histidine kinase [Nostoc sp. CreGUA01]
MKIIFPMPHAPCPMPHAQCPSIFYFAKMARLVSTAIATLEDI